MLLNKSKNSKVWRNLRITPFATTAEDLSTQLETIISIIAIFRFCKIHFMHCVQKKNLKIYDVYLHSIKKSLLENGENYFQKIFYSFEFVSENFVTNLIESYKKV